MLSHKEILNHFQIYDNFLFSHKNSPYYSAFQSLKMMYAIHVSIAIPNSRLFVAKQLLRLIVKLLILPIKTMKLKGRFHSCTVFQTVPHLDISITKDHQVGLVKLQSKSRFNPYTFTILKEWISASKILLLYPTLHTPHALALLHRLLDYFITYYTVEFASIKTLFMENDRFPTSKALIDKARTLHIHTVKFDYWLLDPIHHNDIYCDSYFCPSEYHKKIALACQENTKVTIINGGFPNWDRLNTIQITPEQSPLIVYFTQPTVPINDHKRYIEDLKRYAPNYTLIIKVHPHDDATLFAEFASHNTSIVGKEIHSDTLLAQGKMFFSVFSTISLEAKHLTPYSFFIHYIDSLYNCPIDYNEIGLDVITDTSMLIALFNNRYSPVNKESFIASNNTCYPNSTAKLFELCHES